MTSTGMRSGAQPPGGSRNWFGGTFGLKPMLEAFTAPAIGIVYYIAVRLYRRSQGLSFTQTFAEIPPE